MFLCLSLSNFVRIGQAVSKLSPLMEIQHGGRPPSWIRNYLVLNVTSITKIFFRICMSNFLKISEAVCELWYCIELQYGGRPPSWIFNNANVEVTQDKSNFLLVCVKFCENRSIRSRITAFFRKPLWRSAAILNFQQYDFLQWHKEQEEFSPCACQIWWESVNLLPNYSIFTNQIWRSAAILHSPNANFEMVNLSTVVASACVCQISWESVDRFRNTAFFEIQYGGRQPSWIPNNSNYEVTLRRAVIFWLCVKFRENRSIRSRITAFFRNPIWRPVAILDSWNVRFLSVSPEQDAILR
jgi:hypothetical protein